MDFSSFLVRQHWLTREEWGTLAWRSLKSKESHVSADGYLEPSLREVDPEDFDRLRPFPFGDVLQKAPEILANALRRSDSSTFEELVDRWQQWHVDFVQPISDYCLSPNNPPPFGKRLYDNAADKRRCGEWVAENLVHDADHVIIPEGSSTFWVGLALLAKRSNLRVITSSGALTRELHENPKLRQRANSVSVIGGEMDVEVGGSGRGFVGEATQSGFERAIRREPGATVVVSSVNGLVPESGPFAPCPVTSFTRHALLMDALESNVRTVVFVADHDKMHASTGKGYGDPIFSEKRQWKSILEEHHDRLAFVVCPPPEIRNDPEVMSIRPCKRIVLGKNYPKSVENYLTAAARFDELCSVGGLDSRFFETGDSPGNDRLANKR